MKIKFNKFERVAGLFVLISFTGFAISMISVAVKQGWFETKLEFSTIFESAEGVHPGTTVQIAGLKAGEVRQVELTTENKIFIQFYIFSKFEDKVRQDSVVSLIRPFVIGERVVDISAGQQAMEKVAAGARLPSQESLDLMTVLSGRKLGVYLSSMSEMVGNLHHLAKSFLDKERTDKLIGMFDRIDPLIRNINTMSIEVIKMSKQMNKDGRIGTVMAELAVTTKQLNHILPEFRDRAPQLAQDMSSLVSNLNTLTEEFKVVIPAIAEIAPELPRVSKRSIEALDEAVVLMKALQKSFLVKSNVQEVREEESKTRKPASD